MFSFQSDRRGGDPASVFTERPMQSTKTHLQGLRDGEWISLATGEITWAPMDETAVPIFPAMVHAMSRPPLDVHRERRRVEVENQIASKVKKPRAKKAPGEKRAPRKRRPKVPLHLKAMFEALPIEQQEAMLDSIAAM